MATNLYLAKTSTRVSGYYDLDASSISSGETFVVNTAASGTNIQWTVTAGGSTAAWISPPLASGVTITTGTMYAYEQESNAKANCKGRLKVYRYTGGSESDSMGGPFDDDVEMDNALRADSWTANVTDVAFSAGDRIVVKMFITNNGTMVTGYTCTLQTGSTTYLSLNENLSFTSDSP